VATATGRASVEVPARLPEWIRVGLPTGQYPEIQSTLGELGLATVCREARCPNKSECWSAGTATLMLLGTDCSRRCGFCAVTTRWGQGIVDPTEPGRVAEGIRRWGLRYVVLTQVCRDDLPDGGAGIMAETVRRLRASAPDTLVELLVGDLGGRRASLETLFEEPPDVLAHNIETVRDLSPQVRDRRAGYDRSLELLSRAREIGGPRIVTKSSIMLGLGEQDEEVDAAFGDLRAAGVDLLTLGQYLRPSLSHLSVARYVPPEEFAAWKDRALARGFAGVEAGPLVRSSYHAEQLYRRARSLAGG
jgi:lipoic acid synthetase